MHHPMNCLAKNLGCMQVMTRFTVQNEQDCTYYICLSWLEGISIFYSHSAGEVGQGRLH